MDKQTYIREVAEHVGKEVVIKGWLYARTDKGRLQFLLVRDGSGVIQAVVFRGSVTPEVFQVASTLSQESSIIVRGTVRERMPGLQVALRSTLPICRWSTRLTNIPSNPKNMALTF